MVSRRILSPVTTLRTSPLTNSLSPWFHSRPGYQVTLSTAMALNSTVGWRKLQNATAMILYIHGFMDILYTVHCIRSWTRIDRLRLSDTNLRLFPCSSSSFRANLDPCQTSQTVSSSLSFRALGTWLITIRISSDYGLWWFIDMKKSPLLFHFLLSLRFRHSQLFTIALLFFRDHVACFLNTSNIFRNWFWDSS